MNKCRLFAEEVEFCGHVLGKGKKRPAPGKLLPLEKWEEPRSITALRSFVGFTNYYASYVPGYAEMAAPLQECLKVDAKARKKGSRAKVGFNQEQREAFQNLKKKLCSGLELYNVQPDRPFILRVDASNYAVGAALEQFRDGSDQRPTLEILKDTPTVPVAFVSRKLTDSQRKTWSPREKETYAIVLALLKWSHYIGQQPLLILTDHRSLESWAKEYLDTLSGPTGRRARWHELLSKFDLSVVYIPGKDNVVADGLSRWAYPASRAMADTTIHGSAPGDGTAAHVEADTASTASATMRKAMLTASRALAATPRHHRGRAGARPRAPATPRRRTAPPPARG